MTLRYLDTAIGFAVIMLLLSLLVTTVVQSAIALLNLRGSNLRWGLQVLLGRIDAGMPEAIRKEIADKALMHPAIASAGFLRFRRWAVAIRIEELYRVLHDLAAGTALDDVKPLGAAARDRLKPLLGQPLLAAAQVEQLVTSAAAAGAATVDTAILRARMMQALGWPSKVIPKVSDWFDSVMDRVTQRFTMHSRYLSVAAAVVLTFALRLDTPGVLNRIWSNAALRDQLVAAAPAALRVADSVRTYQDAQKSLSSAAIHQLGEGQADTALKRILTGAPGDLGTLKDGADWLDGALKRRPDSAEVLDAYRQRIGLETDSLLARYGRSSDSVRIALADPALGIFQTPLPPLGYWLDWDHIVRGLISIVLLSLGAPFWYNALKRMANLRPEIASKVEGETKAKGG